MKQECLDCGYCVENSCIHPHSTYCKHSELWTPKWYKVEEYSEDIATMIILFRDNFRIKVCAECPKTDCKRSVTELYLCPKFEEVVYNLSKGNIKEDF